MVVLLDTGILSQLVHTRSDTRRKVRTFIESHIPEITVLVVPEIADYELRRALLRIGSTNSIRMLDQLNSSAAYMALTTAQVRRASEIWARCRRNGFPFCDDKELDGDCFLIAQAEQFGTDAVVLTTNPKDIGRFVKVEILS